MHTISWKWQHTHVLMSFFPLNFCHLLSQFYQLSCSPRINFLPPPPRPPSPQPRPAIYFHLPYSCAARLCYVYYVYGTVISSSKKTFPLYLYGRRKITWRRKKYIYTIKTLWPTVCEIAIFFPFLYFFLVAFSPNVFVGHKKKTCFTLSDCVLVRVCSLALKNVFIIKVTPYLTHFEGISTGHPNVVIFKKKILKFSILIQKGRQKEASQISWKHELFEGTFD